ncbi:MAG: YtxH domain-containing protein [Armatimonadetes bacterium]|nr:YtxH domain-containing protein [Armatimonadota bacterium]
MSNDDERNVLLSVLAGIGLGAVIGATAGLLLAPRAGSETRQDLRKTAEDLKARAEELAGQLSESVDSLVGKSREMVDSAKTKVQQAVDAGKQAVAEKRQELEQQIEGTTEA